MTPALKEMSDTIIKKNVVNNSMILWQIRKKV